MEQFGLLGARHFIIDLQVIETDVVLRLFFQPQHSVTVTPWRGAGGETPFASIRPMSLQSRTVVLPTTNQR